MKKILAVLRSEPVLEKILILIITAGLTGLFAPWVIKRFEAKLALQREFFTARVKFLENISDSVWEFMFISLAVSYYHQPETKDELLYSAAVATYEKETWDLFKKIHKEINKNRRLVSTSQYGKLQSIYGALMVLDADLMALVKKEATKNASPEEWTKLHASIRGELTIAIQDAMDTLSQELKLSVPKAGVTSE